MGHINYDHLMATDIKGLFNLTDDKGEAFNWNIYKLNIDENMLKWTALEDKEIKLPTLLKAEVSLEKVGDVYLDAG